MKTLIDVDREIWGKVKFFATVRALRLDSAVDLLLDHSLTELAKFRPTVKEVRTN
jgi:hypothetical protein